MVARAGGLLANRRLIRTVCVFAAFVKGLEVALLIWLARASGSSAKVGESSCGDERAG
jgi:hypothetical protein